MSLLPSRCLLAYHSTCIVHESNKEGNMTALLDPKSGQVETVTTEPFEY